MDIAFAAGFLEGDGHYSKNLSTQAVEFNQKDKWIIDWFERKFGGAVGQIHKQGISKNSYWRWRVSGEKARNIMRLTYPYLSDYKKNQIDNALKEVK